MTSPRAQIFVGDEPVGAASAAGYFFVGFDRDASASVQIEARSGQGSASRTLDIAAGTFPSTRVDGLPPSTIAPSDPELLARIARTGRNDL